MLSKKEKGAGPHREGPKGFVFQNNAQSFLPPGHRFANLRGASSAAEQLRVSLSLSRPHTLLPRCGAVVSKTHPAAPGTHNACKAQCSCNHLPGRPGGGPPPKPPRGGGAAP